MSAFRTVRSGLSIDYSNGERKKFGRCLLMPPPYTSTVASNNSTQARQTHEQQKTICRAVVALKEALCSIYW